MGERSRTTGRTSDPRAVVEIRAEARGGGAEGYLEWTTWQASPRMEAGLLAVATAGHFSALRPKVARISQE